jgi:hypothetical protein
MKKIVKSNLSINHSYLVIVRFGFLIRSEDGINCKVKVFKDMGGYSNRQVFFSGLCTLVSKT